MKLKIFLLFCITIILGACTTFNYIGYDDVYYTPTPKKSTVIEIDKRVDTTITENYEGNESTIINNYYDFDNDLDYTYRINRFYRPYYNSFYWNDWYYYDWYWDSWSYPYSYWSYPYSHWRLDWYYSPYWNYGIYYDYRYWNHKWNDNKNRRDDFSMYRHRNWNPTDKSSDIVSRRINESKTISNTATTRKYTLTDKNSNNTYTRSGSRSITNYRSELATKENTNRIDNTTRTYTTPSRSSTNSVSSATRNYGSSNTNSTTRTYSTPSRSSSSTTRSYSSPPQRSSSSYSSPVRSSSSYSSPVRSSSSSSFSGASRSYSGSSGSSSGTRSSGGTTTRSSSGRR